MEAITGVCLVKSGTVRHVASEPYEQWYMAGANHILCLMPDENPTPRSDCMMPGVQLKLVKGRLPSLQAQIDWLE